MKREKLTEFNKNNILTAAKALFESKDFFRTTMDDIAKEADCSKSTVYVYFKNKEEIYYSIVYESMCILKKRMEDLTSQEIDFEVLFYDICHVLTEFQREYPLYFASMRNEISVAEEDFERCPALHSIYLVGEEINAVLSKMFQKGMESGRLRKDINPIPAIFTMWASMGGIIMMAEQKEKYFNSKLGISRQEYLDYSFQLLYQSIKAGEKI